MDFERGIRQEIDRFTKAFEATILNVNIDAVYLVSKRNLLKMYEEHKEQLTHVDYERLNEGLRQLDSIHRQMEALQLKKRVEDKINKIVSYSTKIRFSLKRKEKLLNYLNANDLKLSEDEILDHIELFKDSFSNCKWVGNYFLQFNRLFTLINDERNRKKIIELCRFFNRKFVFDDYKISVYYHLYGDVLKPIDFPELSKKEIKRFEFYRKNEIICRGLIPDSKDIKSFLQSLNLVEKKRYFNVIKNNWLNYSLDQLQSLLMTIDDWEEKDFIDEFYNRVFIFPEKGTEYYLITVISILSKKNRDVLLKHQQELFDYLSTNLGYSKKFMLNLLTVLKNENIEGVEEFMMNHQEALIFQMVSSVYQAIDSKWDFSEVEPFLVKKVIDELLEFQNLKFSAIRFIGSGLNFSCYQLGAYVLKIGSHKMVSNCANTEEILQPFIRNQFGRVYIEVLPVLKTKDLDLAEIEKVRENLVRKNISSSDLGDNNFGVLEHPVQVFKMRNGLLLPHQNTALDFSGREVGSGYLTSDLYNVNQYYILDSDCMWQNKSLKR